MAQQQQVTECTVTFDAKKNREYFVGKMSCGCLFRRLVTTGARPPTRMACDYHPEKIDPRNAPTAEGGKNILSTNTVKPVVSTTSPTETIHPLARAEAEASCRLDGDTICVPPLDEVSLGGPPLWTEEAAEIAMTDDEPDILAIETPTAVAIVGTNRATISLVSPPQPAESVTASAPVDPTEYDPVTGKIILNAAVLNRVFAKMYPDKKPY